MLDLKKRRFDCYNSLWSFNVLDDANKYVYNIILYLFVTFICNNIYK